MLQPRHCLGIRVPATCLRDRSMADLGAVSGDLQVPDEVLVSLLRCLQDRPIRFVQIPGLLKASCLHLASLQDKLGLLVRQSGWGQDLTITLENLLAMLHTGQGFSLERLSDCLAQLGNKMGPVRPLDVAGILECRALVAASMQDHTAAIECCRQAAEVPNLVVSQQWHLVHLQAQLLGDQGREFDDEAALQASIELFKDRVLAMAPAGECPNRRATSLESLGKVLGVLGQRRMGIRYLEEAVDVFREALQLRDVGTLPAQWAAAQNGLGNALGVLGQRQSEGPLLDQAVAAFERALEFRTEVQSPADWASTMHNLAAVLQALGQKNKDPKILKRAVEAYKGVLRVWTRNQVPMDWATTMHNLGTALRILGEHRRGPRTLEQAVAAYHSALAERTRERMPEEWAMTHNNLGAALQKLAEREESPAIMQKAIDAYESSLMVWTRDTVPMTWAMTKANLGVARREMAAMAGNVEAADRAVSEIKSAVDVFRGASHAQYTELGEEQLSLARQLLNNLLVATDFDALEATQLALKINT